MPITLNDTTITGIGVGGLPDGIITRPLIGYSGAVLQVQHIQTRTQGTYAAPVIAAGTGLSNAGTEIAPVTISVTPQKAGNKIIIEWMMNNECHWDTSYVVTRNGTIMTDSADSNRWSGLNHNNYESAGDLDSTPVSDKITFIDNSTLATTTTYRLHIRSSGASARTYYLNRPVRNTGADNLESGVSTVTVTEINV